MSITDLYDEIWVADFEFSLDENLLPDPLCLVAHEIKSGASVRLWRDDMRSMAAPPYAVGCRTLFVAYYASAEFGCHLALNWQIPVRILDLFTEFRCATNGLEPPGRNGLLGAAAYWGLDSISVGEKAEMRKLILRGGEYSQKEREQIFEYCAADVSVTSALFRRMESQIDLPRALLRGRFMGAAARIERTGVPIDSNSLLVLREVWPAIKGQLISEIDKDYGLYDHGAFKIDRFARFLEEHKYAWPTTPTGRPSLEDDTFAEMAKVHPELYPLRELRVALSKMRSEKIAVGKDSRNRCLISAFRSRTSRNQPSTNEFIFGPSVWLRSLIQPQSGWAIAYCDYSQQEFGVAASFSGDRNMMDAYTSGDPYLAFAIQSGFAPVGATKATHGAAREQSKQCVLGVQYGMEAKSLSFKIGEPEAAARALLRAHKATYPQYWEWSDAVLDSVMLHGCIQTVFGWQLHVKASANPRSIRNFPMQAHGAEMLRIACCLATERGIRVCAPVHDALLVESPIDEIDDTVRRTQAAMAEASALTLSGFTLRSDAKVFKSPQRYVDERGKEMWEKVWRVASELGVPHPNGRIEGVKNA